MKAQLRWATALIACIGTVQTLSVQAQQGDYRTANYAAEMAAASFAEYNSYDTGYDSEFEYDSGGGSCDLASCDCDGGSCSGGCLGGGGGILSRPGQFFIGADYLNVRSTFSESTAFVVTTGTRTAVNGVLLQPTHTFHELEYDYESSYRIFGGYRLCECGGEVRFAFTNFDNISGTAASPQANPGVNPGDNVVEIIHPGEAAVTQLGGQVFVNSNVDAKSYDLGFAKTIPLGSPASSGCGCDDNCCDSCCGWCPAWDIKWYAGIRFAEVNWDRNVTNTLTTGDFRTTTMDFEGGGIRTGLEGTRYIGRQQRFAVFAKGDISLLLGTVNIEAIEGTNPAGVPPSVNRTTRFSSNQIIPVLDIEAGGTFFVTDRLTVAAGYLFSAWHDLGMRDTFDVLNGQTPTFDDANILGFDGYFVRTEFAF